MPDSAEPDALSSDSSLLSLTVVVDVSWDNSPTEAATAFSPSSSAAPNKVFVKKFIIPLIAFGIISVKIFGKSSKDFITLSIFGNHLKLKKLIKLPIKSVKILNPPASNSRIELARAN